VPELIIRTFEAPDIDSVWALHREGLEQTTPEYPEVMPDYEADLGTSRRTTSLRAAASG
jgi:hypothetical protein